MPEGPELHLASRFVNKCCKGTVFSGNIVKSEVHKSEEIKFKSDAYTISATSRGKELQLFLSSVQDDKKSAKKAAAIDPQSHAAILFRFGMSGKFEFTAEADLHKHAHLKFFTKSEPRMVLSYVDVRRFGRFEETTQWGKDRGPDPMFEYKEFRYSISFYYHCGRIFFQFQDELYDVIFKFNHIKLNVLESLSSSEFDRPICEVLLNQKYFNGIGNYLRAEILYSRKNYPDHATDNQQDFLQISSGLHNWYPTLRTGKKSFEDYQIPPDVKPKMKGSVSKNKDQKADILHLCHSVPLEVVNLGKQPDVPKSLLCCHSVPLEVVILGELRCT
ncbi:putative endonuclease 8-like 1-like [Apostichopus japonicus]|uniref:Putative endonuclease 8-like 1-like n=1 Tax=Stichopus japonicus TaxID=307972 RepID=A0A2G8LM90_STIJA|nr:putative endonuclease 8-like 1-like [Apostichopus japonicus]